MSEDFALKKALKDVNCYLEATLKECEKLTEENNIYHQLLTEEREAYRNLKRDYKDLEDASKEKINYLEEELQTVKQDLDSCREDNNMLIKQIYGIEEELSLTKIQSDTYKNDFGLERESREKLNDEKLLLESRVEALEEAMRKKTLHFDEGSGKSLTVSDGRSPPNLRCPACREL